MALGLRQDLEGTGVGVTTVFPGFIRDAGMFHDSGTKLPPGVGTRTPEQVAEAVAQRNRARSARGRRRAALAAARCGGRGCRPGTMAALQRRMGGPEIASRIAEGQTSKR